MHTRSFMPASAGTDGGMTQFTCEAIMPVYQLSIGNNAASHSRAEGNHDKIFHPSCSTIHHFAKSGRFCIIGQGAGEIKFLCHHFCQGNNSLPLEIRSIFNGTCIIITVGSPDANAFDMSVLPMRFNNGSNCLM